MAFRLKPIQHIPFLYLGGFSLLVFCLQLIQGTSLSFAIHIFLFNIFVILSFNLVEGLSSIAGWLILLFSLRHVIISQLTKIFIWQAADIGLLSPDISSLVYSVGALAVLAAAFLVAVFNNKSQQVMKLSNRDYSPKISWGLFICGGVCIVAVNYQNNLPFILRPLINLMSYLQPLTLCGLGYEVSQTLMKTEGKTLFNRSAIIMFLICFARGVLVAAKQYMFEPLLVLLVSGVFYRYQLKVKQLAVTICTLVLMIFILTPLSDHGRTAYRQSSLLNTVSSLGEYIGAHFGSVSQFQDYQKTTEEEAYLGREKERYYFGRKMTLIDRFSIMHDADELISVYQYREGEGGPFFWKNLYLLPRSLTGKWIDLEENTGDYLAHIAGVIPEGNIGTAVSFGIFAEAFAIGKWWGLFFIPFGVLFFYLFFLKKLECKDYGLGWPVFLVLYLEHLFSEAGVVNLLMIMVRIFPLLLILGKIIHLFESSISNKNGQVKNEI
ncbi:MAG: hypothetical protein EXR74_01500 [Bdellovibrionales bacterium]|nr:hypothetical protein [Bdellovibrionales bacterium]